MEYLTIVIIVLAVWLFFSCVRIVPQATEYVIEFLGKYKTTWSAGFHLKIPILERIAKLEKAEFYNENPNMVIDSLFFTLLEVKFKWQKS